jgi:hypothetical protein
MSIQDRDEYAKLHNDYPKRLFPMAAKKFRALFPSVLLSAATAITDLQCPDSKVACVRKSDRLKVE